jgi:hypothetical protein
MILRQRSLIMVDDQSLTFYKREFGLYLELMNSLMSYALTCTNNLQKGQEFLVPEYLCYSDVSEIATVASANRRRNLLAIVQSQKRQNNRDILGKEFINAK